MSAQLERLREVLAAIETVNPFWAPRLAEAEVNSHIASLAEFSRRLPLLAKTELAADQAEHPPYGRNLTFPLERYTRFCQTSGTTARPLVILDTPESWNWMLGNWLRIYQAAGIGPGDRIYFAFSFGPFLGFWTAFEAAAKLGLLCIPGGGLSTVGRLRVLLEHRATVLCCTPTYALHLAEVAARENLCLGPGSMRTLIVAGEPGGSVPAVRAKLESAWPGARIIDHYGMTEVGPVAFQPPDQTDLLEIIEDSYLAELVHPATGEPTAPSEIGELILTTLGRTACPLLRYRTGDLARRSPGEGPFRLESGIVGRADDMIVIRGVNLYPAAVDAVIHGVPGITEYRVEISHRGALREAAVVIECDDSSGPSRLEDALTAAFALRMPVRRTPAGSLPRFEMKGRRWVHDSSPGA